MHRPAMAAPPVATAPVADALARLKLPLRLAPPGLSSVIPGSRLAGPCLPARHAGSVDVFLEALEASKSGDVLVVDNGGRLDEACVGDLTMLEAQSAGLAGCLVWGFHRDTEELRRIGLPVFSYGRYPQGPLAPRPRAKDALQTARFGPHRITAEDYVVADDDGAVFVGPRRRDEVLRLAAEIQARERAQADRVRAGTSLRTQFRFRQYLAKRAKKPTYTFREHLEAGGGAIEV
jgi:4-hydroxy-4-methyl-2-oxoglutarate aldolase